MKELEEIRLRNDAYQTYGGIKGDRHSAEDVPRLLDALEAVLNRCDAWEEANRTDGVGSGFVVAADFRSVIASALGAAS